MTPTPPADDAAASCRCGHARGLHDHDRPGSDCGVGGPGHCASFRHATPLLQRLVARVARPAPVDDNRPLAPVLGLAAARSARTVRARVVASSAADAVDLPRVAP